MDTRPGIERILEVARLEGVPYDVVPGYETRGSGEFTAIDTALDHHDAFPARTGAWGGLRTCTFGRSDLRNSLCMFYLSSEQRVPGWAAFAAVAAKPSWHAGKGRRTTNPRSRGIEARNDGLGEPWPPWQLRTYLFLDAMTVIVWGAEVLDHKEHSSTGKIDRTGIDPHDWRRQVDDEVDRLLAKYPGLRTGGPLTPNPEEPLMVTAEDERKLNALLDAKLKPILDVLAGIARKAFVVRDPRDKRAWVVDADGRWHVPDRRTLDVLLFTGQVATYGKSIPVADPAWLDGIPITAAPTG